ncbi:hypothetical protein BKA23_2379 [Rudaeicoccus suwonensis]|uniref:AAA domain-containing protein n=1 Tax=Rudaeicoccus suwonensis TaxID=657409 RepID=A0A561E368_9MICO|nr:hypothetical protein BKA23_2379 [Rudaeicoccus suwonensis]
MIVVVEGPSAAGKTTWCHRSGLPVVEEYVPSGREPDRSDVSAQAAYWTEVNSARWAAARKLEMHNPVVLCDTDPVKLHYSWCLNRIGVAPRDRFAEELAAVRRAFAEDRLGFADVVVTAIPSMATLSEHRQADHTRQRRSFDLHAQLSDPLRQWYHALDGIEPGHVLWQFPEPSDLQARLFQPRSERSDPARLDRLMSLLPKL